MQKEDSPRLASELFSSYFTFHLRLVACVLDGKEVLNNVPLQQYLLTVEFDMRAYGEMMARTQLAYRG